jgi:hypothetical protein
MRNALKIPAVLCASVAMIGQSFAADVCAKPDEAMALKTAAMQQELMVAALSCDDIGAYNRFVISHQRELQESDATLLNYFQRASARGGADNYNAYKTALANDFSLASLRGRQAFCYAADTAFGDAFNARDPSLASFVSAQPVSQPGDYQACGGSGGQIEAVAGGSSAAPTRLATQARD